MPIKVSNAPKMAASAEHVAKVANEFTAPWRNYGEATKLEKPPAELQKAAKGELKVLAEKVIRAQSIDKAESLQFAEVLTLTDKLDKGEQLTAQEMGQVWVMVSEARGNEVGDHVGVGGVYDPESIFHIADRSQADAANTKLKTLQENVEMYLTGETELTEISHMEGGRIRNRKKKVDRAARDRVGTVTEAQKAFKGRADYIAARNRVSQDRFNTDWASLSEQQSREVQGQVLEDVLRLQGSKRVDALVNRLGGSVDVKLVDEAGKSTNPREKALAAMAKNIEATRERILREGSRVDRMRTMDEWLLFMGVDVNNPNQTGILTRDDVARSAAQYFGLEGVAADALLQNPNDALRFIQRSTSDSAIFVGKLYEGKLRQFALERDHKIPDTLKKPRVEPKDKLRNSLTAQDAAYALLLRFGNDGESYDPASFLQAQFGLPADKALKFVEEGFLDTNKWLVNPAGVAELADGSRPVRANVDTIVSWGKPEMWVEAEHRGLIDDARLRTQLENSLTGQYGGQSLTDEVDRRMKEYQDLKAARNMTGSSASSRPDQIAATKKWDPKQLALLMVLGVGIAPQMGPIMEETQADKVTEFVS